MARINIVTADNGVGLTNTSAIIRDVLVDDGHDAHVHTYEESPSGTPRYHLTLFLERIIPAWLDVAERNAFVPNQEWFGEQEREQLGRIDDVLCKTRYAAAIFRELGCRTHELGFTSRDRGASGIEPAYDRFFHLAGHSSQKGTGAVVAAWNAHPQWSELCLVQHPPFARDDVTAHNIRYVTAYLDDDALGDEQRRHGVHLCPSEAEGWGHSIVEAMSCAALVVTTDAPPMNELVRDDRGVLVPYARRQPQGVGTNYHVDPEALSAAVEHVLQMDAGERRALGQAARGWYEENDHAFRSRLRRLVAELTGEPTTGRRLGHDPVPAGKEEPRARG